MALLWNLVTWGGAGAGLFGLFFLFSFLRSYCCYTRRRGRQEKQVPHKDPVELYVGRISVETQKLRCCLVEKGVEFKEHFIDAGFFGRFDNLKSEHRQKNPNCTNPFLVHNGYPVLETDDIVLYLESKFSSTPLVPSTKKDCEELDKWVKATVMVANARCNENGRYSIGAAVRLLTLPVIATTERYLSLRHIVLAVLRHPNPMSEFPKIFLWLSVSLGAKPGKPTRSLINAALSSVAAGLAEIEQRLSDGRKFLVGAKFSYADICVESVLWRLDQLGLLDKMLDKLAKTRSYWSRLMARESFKPAFQTPEEHPGALAINQAFAKFAELIKEKGIEGAYGREDEEEEEED